MSSSDWPEVQLGDLVTIKHGWPFKSQYFSEQLAGRPIVVNIGNFEYTGGFRFDSTRVKEYRGEYPSEYELTPGETLLVMTCQTAGGEILGIPAKVPDDGRVYLHNQRIGRVVNIRPDAVDSRYLYWLFLSPVFNRELATTASGSKILHTSPSRIEAFRFRLPPLITQQRVAATLDGLQNKIELNRQMNGTLESIARAIFKSWFVDFDPVRKKMEGKTGGELGLPPSLAALFPDRLMDSRIGEIPEGWEVCGLGQCLSLLKDGSHNPPQRVLDGIPFIAGATDVKHFSVDFAKCTHISEGDYAAMHRKWSIQAGDVLLTIVGTVGNVAIVAPYDLPFSLQRSIAVLRPCPELSSSFLYCLLDSAGFRADVESRLNPTGQPGIYLGTLAAIPVCLPAQRVVGAFDTFASAAFTRMQSLVQTSRKLAALRDSFLPRLISGELHIKDAECLLENAAE